LVKKIVQFNFFSSIRKPLVASFLMIVAVYVLSIFFAKDLLSLVFVILAGGVIYSTCMFALSGKELKTDLVRFGIRI
jgi:hypothetical protein